MAPKQRMSHANDQFSKNVLSRGNIKLKSQTDKLPVPGWLIAVFIFVVCGSAIFELIRSVKLGF